MKPVAVLLPLLVLCVSCSGARAAAPPLSIVIYSGTESWNSERMFVRRDHFLAGPGGYGLVRREAMFELKRGLNVLRLEEANGAMDPASVAFESLTDPIGTRLVGQSWELGDIMPSGKPRKRTLAWQVHAEQAGMHKVRYSYETGGLSWHADYSVVYQPGPGESSACRLQIGAWVTLDNQSGVAFEDANVRLVAGDADRPAEQETERGNPPFASAAPGGYPPERPAKPAFMTYRTYTLERPVTLQDGSSRRVELFPAVKDIACEKHFVYAGQGRMTRPLRELPVTDRNPGGDGIGHVNAYLRFRNIAPLGISLPPGGVLLRQPNAAGGEPELARGEMPRHTPKGAAVAISLTAPSGLTGKRRQLGFRLSDAEKWMEEDIEISLRNRNNEAVVVAVEEAMQRWTVWGIIKKSQDFKKQDEKTVNFSVPLPPQGDAVVRYTVRYTW